jgi:hypothetical protein
MTTDHDFKLINVKGLLGGCPRTQNQPFGATQFPSFPSSGVGTASWESKLELLHSCVPKLELGNKVGKSAFSDRLLVAFIILLLTYA